MYGHLLTVPSHGGEKKRQRELISTQVSSDKGTKPFMEASKAPYPNTITLGIRVLTHECRVKVGWGGEGSTNI